MSAVGLTKVGFVLLAFSYLGSTYLSLLTFNFLVKSEDFQNTAAVTPLRLAKSQLNRK